MTTRKGHPERVSSLTLRAGFTTVIISRTSAEGFRLAGIYGAVYFDSYDDP